MALSTDDIAGMQATITSLLPDSCTNSRTAATLPHRLDDGTVEYRPFSGQRLFLLRAREYVGSNGQDVKAGDRLTRTDGVWLVVVRIESPSYSLDTRALIFQLPSSVTASTKRNPSSIVHGSTANITTHLSSVTVWTFFGNAIHGVGQQFAQDTFGVDIVQPSICIVDTPAETEAFPVAPGDRLSLSGGIYTVRGLLPFAPSLTALLLDVQQSATPTP